MRTNMRFLLAAILALAVSPALRAGAPAAEEPEAQEPFKRLEVDQVEKLLSDPAVHIYDGNKAEVYKKHHLPGAVTLYSKDIKEGSLPANKDAVLVFYCQNVH